MTVQSSQKNILPLCFARFGRGCAYAIIGLILLILLLFSGATLFLYQNPEALSKGIAEEIKQRTGIETSFSSVDVTLFPLPALALSNVVLKYDQIKLNIAFATARPAILPLLRGDFAIGHASLLRPVLSGVIADSHKDIQKTPSSDVSFLDYFKNHPLNIPIPNIIHGSDLNIIGGNINLLQSNTQINVDNINADINISKFGDVSASLSFDSGIILQDQALFAKATALTIDVAGLAPENYQDLTINLNTRLHITDILEQGSITLACSTDPISSNAGNTLPHLLDMLSASLSIDGSLMWHKQAIPFAITGNMRGHADSSFEFINTNISLDKDKLILNATLNNIFSQSPHLDGHISVERLSLTQWFGFARNLPPGLQVSLDHITNGELQFSIDEKGLKVPHIKASAVDADFIGKGGVSSWKNVVVFLDLTSPNVSLLKAFPETEGVEVVAPSFPYPSLTPIPGTPEAINSPGPSVGYDINIGAKSLTTWNLTVNDVKFSCIPAEPGQKINPKNHPNAVLLSFGIDNFYGGRGDAKAILFRTNDNKSGYDITAILRNINSNKPLSILAGREIMGGKLSIDATVLSYGKNLGQFLISKTGQVSMRVDNGYFTSKDKKRTTFTQFNTAGTFDSAPLTKKMVKNMPEVLRYNGQWKSKLKRPDLYWETSLNGILTFVGRNYTDIVLDKVSGKSELTLQPELTGLNHEIASNISGTMSLDTTKSTTSIINAHASIPKLANTEITGSVYLNYLNDLQWNGNINVQNKQLSKLLAQLSSDNTSPIVDTAPQEINVQTKFTKNVNGLHLTNLKVELDNMSASGTIHKSSEQRPMWDVALAINLLDWDRLFTKDIKVAQNKPQSSATSSKSSKVNSKNWSLAWLRENDAKGHINIEILRMYKSNANNIHIPIDMQNNVLHLKNIVGTFYGGPAKLQFMGKALGDALQIQGGAQVEKVNMLPLSHDLELKTAIGGTGSIWFSMQGVLTNSTTILPLLDGTWRIKIEKGFLQTRNVDGSLQGSPTKIDEMQDAGPLSNGILYSKNLVIKGPDLNVTGKGKVDLVKSTLDMNLLASVAGIDNIGVHYYGSLDEPKRDINTGSLIVGALSTFGTGIFDIIGGVFEGFFNLLRPNKN